MLTLQSPDVYLIMAGAVVVGVAGMLVLRGRRAPLTGELIVPDRSRPERRHVYGGIVFGTGWAIVASCPGPLVAQLGSGRLLAAAGLGGVLVGVLARERGRVPAAVERPAVEPLPDVV
jgi:uncharacterized membrane protein YedE/YeeE